MTNNLFDANLTERARKFFNDYEAQGKPESLHDLAQEHGLPWSTVWKWVHVTQPKLQSEGINWPYDSVDAKQDTEADIVVKVEKSKYSYDRTADIYHFFLTTLHGAGYPVPGGLVRQICRDYSNQLGPAKTSRQIAQSLGLGIPQVTEILQILGKTHSSDPFTPEEMEDTTVDELVAQSVDMKRQKYLSTIQTQLARADRQDAEKWRLQEFTHEQRMSDFTQAIADFEQRYVPEKLNFKKLHKITGPHLLDLSLNDLHYGKLAIQEVSGSTYNRDLARKAALWAVEKLLSNALFYEIDQILFEVGNDLFHVDTYRNVTTKGTPQDVDGMSETHFGEVLELIISCIDLLSQVAPVHVPIVPGNHDRERCGYLGAALKQYYRNNPNVTIDASLLSRKYFRYGTTVIGKTHGDGPADSKLPMILAIEAAEHWGDTLFREMHVSHKHMHEYREIMLNDELTGVRLRRKPSLSGTDRWHSHAGWIGAMRSAEAYIYHKEQGYAGQISVNLSGANT